MKGSPRIDLGFIRVVLAEADETSTYAVAKRHNMHAKTITRWQKRREAEGPQWPTDDDIAAWRDENHATAARRDRDAQQNREYRNRVYLNRGRVQVPALSTTRRLQALAALGWYTYELGDRMGVSPARVGHLTTGEFTTVYPATAAAVAKLYDDLHLTNPPPHVGPKDADLRARTARWAVAKGYFVPLMWDNIDDPDEKPRRPTVRQLRAGRGHQDVDHALVQRLMNGDYTVAVDASNAERVIVCQRLIARGMGYKEIERATGWAVNRYYLMSDESKAG